jgi:gas vesicle protein
MHKTEDTIALLGGVLMGAAAMYLLDPEAGRKRRGYLQQQAERAWGNAGEMLHEGVEGITRQAQNVGHMISDQGQAWASQAKDAMHNLQHQGSKLASRYSDQAHGYAKDYADQAHDLWQQAQKIGRNWGSQAQSNAERARSYARSQLGHGHSAAIPATVAAVGCCAVGLGVMYLIDPSKGRSRRDWITNSISGLIRRTGNSFNRAGQGIAERVSTESSGFGGQRYPSAGDTPGHQRSRNQSARPSEGTSPSSQGSGTQATAST